MLPLRASRCFKWSIYLRFSVRNAIGMSFRPIRAIWLVNPIFQNLIISCEMYKCTNYESSFV